MSAHGSFLSLSLKNHNLVFVMVYQLLVEKEVKSFFYFFTFSTGNVNF